MQVKAGQRKVRSDKKRDIKPTIPITLYECISRLSYITNTPIKDVGVTICKKGLYSAAVMEYLANYFKRDYWANNNTLYIGDITNPMYQFPKDTLKKRLTMRFKQSDHEEMARLAYSLDVSVSSCANLLLDASIKNTDILNAFISGKVKKELDPQRMKQLREVYKFMNENNPYNEKVSFSMFISVLLDELKQTSFKMSQSLQDWLDKHDGLK